MATMVQSKFPWKPFYITQYHGNTVHPRVLHACSRYANLHPIFKVVEHHNIIIRGNFAAIAYFIRDHGFLQDTKKNIIPEEPQPPIPNPEEPILYQSQRQVRII